MSQTEVWVCANPAEEVKKTVARAEAEAIARKGSFTIAIAGGSLVKMLGAMADMPEVQWNKWYVGWVDERCLPHSDPESNYGGAQEAWLSKVSIPEAQLFPINADLTPGGGGMEVAAKAAEDMDARLKAIPETVLPRNDAGLPIWDMLLLGFGPDGHICSLFPGHPLLDDTSDRWILPIADSPKPPPERVTFSLNVVNAANQVMLIGTGDAKAGVLSAVFKLEVELPCGKAKGAAPGAPIWVVDKPAAAGLPAEATTFKLVNLE